MLRLLCFLLLLMGLYPPVAHCQSAKGRVKDGKPVGLWEYYDAKELGLRFDYDSSRIQYVRPDTTRYLVLVDTAWQTRQLYRAPRVLGSQNDLIRALQMVLRYPIQEIRNRVTGTVVLTFVVDQQGALTNPVAVTAPSKALAEEVYKKVASLPFTYLPAIYQGRRTPAKIAFVVRFCICKPGADCDSASLEQARLVPKPLGSMGEIIVTTPGLY